MAADIIHDQSTGKLCGQAGVQTWDPLPHPQICSDTLPTALWSPALVIL